MTTRPDVGDTMSDFIGKIFRMPGEGKPISIIDVSGVPSDITSTVVAVAANLPSWRSAQESSTLRVIFSLKPPFFANQEFSSGSKPPFAAISPA